MIFTRRTQANRWAAEVLDLTWAGRQACLVQAAHATGVFRRLGAGPTTARQAADDLGLDAAALERALIALAATGLADRQGDIWHLTPKAHATLLSGALCYQGHAIAHGAQVAGIWYDLESVLRGRRGGWVYCEEGRPGHRSHRDFILAMHNMAMAGRGAQLAERVDLRGRRALMDVGGGPGSYAMALVERTPGLTATVLDLPETIEIAREVIARLGMSDRVRTLPGDWNTSDFGEGNDAVMLSNVLHGPESRAEMKLAKAHRSLAPGGILIVQDFLLNAEKTGPVIPALFNVMVGAFSLPELLRRLSAAGFDGVEVKPMPPRVGTTVLTAVKRER